MVFAYLLKSFYHTLALLVLLSEKACLALSVKIIQRRQDNSDTFSSQTVSFSCEIIFKYED